MSITAMNSTSSQTTVAPVRQAQAVESRDRAEEAPKPERQAPSEAPPAQTTNLQGQVIGQRINEKA